MMDMILILMISTHWPGRVGIIEARPKWRADTYMPTMEKKIRKRYCF